MNKIKDLVVKQDTVEINKLCEEQTCAAKIAIVAMQLDNYTMFNYVISEHELDEVAVMDMFRDYIKPGRKYAKYLLKLFASFRHVQSFSDYYWLEVASVIGKEMVVWMLKQGLNVNDIYNGYTILHYAVQNSNVALVKILLQNGANPNLQCCNGYTPFMLSLLYGSSKISSMLFDLDKGHAKCICGNGLLLALSENNYYYAYKLIQKGLDVNCDQGKHFNSVDLYLKNNKVNLKLFRAIWKRFDYKKVYGKKTTTVINKISILDKQWFQHLLVVIESEKLKYVVDHGNKTKNLLMPTFYFPMKSFKGSNLFGRCHLIGFMAAMLCDDCKMHRLLKTAILKLLKNGVQLFSNDLEVILTVFGMCDFVEQLLSYKVYIIEESFATNNILAQLSIYISLSEYWIKNSCIDGTDEGDLVHKFFAVKRDVPKLLELSRNILRVSVCNIFNIKSVSELFSALHLLNFPKFVIDIIMLKTPIYCLH